MELRLARVLRHVAYDTSVNIMDLVKTVARAQKIQDDDARAYIWELIADDYLTYNSDAFVSRGSVEYPPEIQLGGYYSFESECWSCGKTLERKLDIYTNKILWACDDCQVKWTEATDR